MRSRLKPMRCRHRFPRLLLIALVVGAAVCWWRRSRSRVEADSSPADFGAEPGAEPAPAPNPVVDEEAEEAEARWVLPVDGECPPGYPVKANDNSGIYHLPGGRSYERTVAERCYATAEAAEADGYRQSKT